MNPDLLSPDIGDAPTSHILLLIASHKNRRLLTQCLREEYVVEAPEPFSEAGRAALDENTWDACISDGPVLSEYWRQIKRRKRKNSDEFVPFLLVTSHQQVKSTTRQLWRLVDEVIVTPIEKNDLLARTEVLLRAQRYPRRWSKRYTTLTEVAPVGIVSLDIEGVVTYANAQAEELLAGDEGTAVGRSADSWPATDFDGNVLSAEERAFYRIVHRKEAVHNMQVAVERPDQESLLLSVNAAPLFDEEGHLNGVLLSFDDVTERERRVQELREAKEEAESMSRLKSSFLANMSHEIRTPLTGILGFTEVLAESAQGGDREVVELIQESGQRLHDLLTSLLDFSQLESETLELSPRRLDVAAELQGLCRPFAVQAAGKSLGFELDLPERPAEACLDPSAFGRVVGNLLSNAIKFTRQGQITVTLKPHADDVELRVADTGVGIDAAFLPELFEPFRQESKGLARDFEGSGLGLAITQELVRLMGGTINLETRKGVGTTFRVMLPRNTYALQEEAEPAKPHAPSAVSDPPVSDHRLVLVAEDNLNTCRLLQRLLSSYEVAFASTGEEALELAEERRFDAVVLDINLGQGMSGEAVLRALRHREPYQNTPVLALTAHALPGDRDRLIQAGFDGYLSKPFKGRELRQAMRLLVALGEPAQCTGSPDNLSDMLEAAAQHGAVGEYGHDDGMVVLQHGGAYLRVPPERALPALRHLLCEA